MLSLRVARHLRGAIPCSLRRGLASAAAAEAVEVPTDDFVTPISSPADSAKTFSPQITAIVDQIAGLTLVQVSELNDALRERLNLPDLGAMPMMGAVAAAPAAAAADAAEAEDEPVSTKTSFKVNLVKFEADKKIALIKEIKATVPGINLVQAKKFVEGVPAIVVNDVGQDEAAKIKASLEAVGGVCEIA